MCEADRQLNSCSLSEEELERLEANRRADAEHYPQVHDVPPPSPADSTRRKLLLSAGLEAQVEPG